MSDANPVAEAQEKQADPATAPAPKAAPAKDPVTGQFTEKVDKAPEPKQEDHFRNTRRELKQMQKAVAERDERIRLQDERISTLLDVFERRTKQAEPAADPLAHLAKDDPDRALIERKIAPLLAKRNADPEIESLKETVKRLQEKEEAKAASTARFTEFQTVISEIAEDRGLSTAVANSVREAILGKKVGGDTYEDAFDNALVYLKGAGKYPGNGKSAASGGDEGQERTSVGGVMPGQAGASVPSDDYRTLRKNWHAAKEEGSADGEADAFHAILRKAQSEMKGA